MEDWRLRGQEDYLSNATLYKVQFPEFWQLAYESKNPFYQKIAAYANEQVERTGQWAELLEGKKYSSFGMSTANSAGKKPIHIKSANSSVQKTCIIGYVQNVSKILQSSFIGR